MFNAGSSTGFVQTLGFTPKLWQFELAESFSKPQVGMGDRQAQRPNFGYSWPPTMGL